MTKTPAYESVSSSVDLSATEEITVQANTPGSAPAISNGDTANGVGGDAPNAAATEAASQVSADVLTSPLGTE
ncbi:MAG: hypothetical protein WCO50_08630, partial [Synechococcus sp. ELA619]